MKETQQSPGFKAFIVIMKIVIFLAFLFGAYLSLLKLGIITAIREGLVLLF